MKEIRFINKVWESPRGRALDRTLNICCWIYLTLDLVVMFSEGIQTESLLTFVAAVVIVIWSRRQLKKGGQYIQTECIITFSQNKIVWEYPSIDLPVYKGKSDVKYIIDADKVENISISHEINSLRLECFPLVEYIGEKKKKTIDFEKRRKSCVLILYNYDLDVVKNLFEEYIEVNIDIVD